MSAVAPDVIYGKDQYERDAARIAASLGCDKTETISGVDYLVIYLFILEEQGVADPAMKDLAIQIACAAKANNSALRQHLYQRKEEAKTSNKANKYLNKGL
jgi:hypothetical protein